MSKAKRVTKSSKWAKQNKTKQKQGGSVFKVNFSEGVCQRAFLKFWPRLMVQDYMVLDN